MMPHFQGAAATFERRKYHGKGRLTMLAEPHHIIYSW